MQEGDKPKNVDAQLAATAREQYGVISRTQALAAGLSSTTIHRRLSEGLWLPSRCGVYRFAATTVTWEQSLMAACLQIPGAVAYGRTAGWLYGLDGLGTTAPSRLELAVERTRNPRSEDLTVYRVRKLKGQWTHRDGIPVIHLPKTLIVLAGMLPERAAELALDSATRSRPGLKSWLTRELAKYPPNARGGPRVMRKLLALRKSPSDSGLEVKFEQLIREADVPEPTYRMPVFDEDGRIGSIDYIWADHRVVVQTHGWRWHGHRLRWQVDIEQRRRLNVDGWRVIEVTRADLRDRPAEIVKLLRRALGRAAAFSSHEPAQTQPDWG